MNRDRPESLADAANEDGPRLNGPIARWRDRVTPAFAYAGFERGYARHLAKHDGRPWVAPLWKALVTLDQPLRLAALKLRAARGSAQAQRQLGAVQTFVRDLPSFWSY